jgi:uncharacterized protein YcaQ
MGKTVPLTITRTTQRQFILGQQGLYPGRRWQGQAGVVQALAAGSVVQVDPLNVVARNHDIVLYGRVQDYRPAHLEAALYTDRTLFDYGGTVQIFPMAELPYWRVVMGRKQQEARRVAFAGEHGDTIAAVLQVVRERGPLGPRDFTGGTRQEGSFRSSKVTSQALYYLWLAGEVMTHSRRGSERVYDLRERIAPSAFAHAAGADEADDFFARKVFTQVGLVTARSWRNGFAGTIERRVERAEAAARLEALQAAGTIVPVTLEGDPKNPRYVLTGYLPLLEAVQAGEVPAEWGSVDATTNEEMIFLGPLEIVSTRGRAQALFDFEYLWEVYKPAEKRRWGYYTLPILYGDRLVARLDPKLDRGSSTLLVKGFWPEADTVVDEAFIAALAAAFRRFMRFVGATGVELDTLPAKVRSGVAAHLRDGG